MDAYVRPIALTDPARPRGALPLAGGWCWFDHVELLYRDGPSRIVPARQVSGDAIERLSARRSPLLGQDWSRPAVMGVLNVTPDSFSDGGLYEAKDAALHRARELVAEGADLIDIGGESTRPGAKLVPTEAETSRVVPVVGAARELGVPLSIDTRKSRVADAAVAAGAALINDISGSDHDPAILEVAAQHRVPVCLMHAAGDPETMQQNPSYRDVALDIYDHLSERVARAEAAGVPREHIIVDPGIGFGKTHAHNLALLRRLTLFHALGCPVLVGVSRKSFIGALSGVADPARRMPGSLAAAMSAVACGAQLLRVHDVEATRQAVSVMLPLMTSSGETE